MNFQDLDGLVLLSRRRARDEKATVRKSGLQLMEAILLMCVRGSGGAPPQLPTEADIEAIEVATADPLVTPLPFSLYVRGTPWYDTNSALGKC